MAESTIAYAVETADLKPLIAALMEVGRVVGPVAKGNLVDFADISSPDEVVVDDRVPYKSPKEFAFPQNEAILRMSDAGAEQIVPEGTTVVFGARPCDLEGLRVMEAVFSGGRYADPFFAERRKRLVFVGLGCLAMKPGCFCDERGVDLADSPYSDIFVSPIDGGFRIEARSPKGEEILRGAGSSIGTAAGPKAAAKAPAAATAPKRFIALPDAPDNEVFGLKAWDEISRTCIGCGTCSFICPTCHCFVFKDIEEGGTITRYRQWDCCMFSNFTMHASGHNPRSTKKERLRQRVMHKYLYVPKNTGLVACSGCGRCVRSCPAGVSIRDAVIAASAELAASAAPASAAASPKEGS